MHGKRRCFLFQAPISFLNIFLHILLGVLISHYFSFDSKDGEKNLQNFSIIYCRSHLRPYFKVGFWISTLTHEHWEAGPTSQEKSSLTEGWEMCLTDARDLRHSNPDLCLEAGAGASVWWKGLLGNSSSHLVLHFGLWPLLLFLSRRRNSCLYFKILHFHSISIHQILIECLCLLRAKHCAKSYKDENYLSSMGKEV